jgi:hypothetical protein
MSLLCLTFSLWTYFFLTSVMYFIMLRSPLMSLVLCLTCTLLCMYLLFPFVFNVNCWGEETAFILDKLCWKISTVRRFRRLLAGHSPLRRRFKPRPVHVGFMLDYTALGQFLPIVFLFSLFSFISPATDAIGSYLSTASIDETFVSVTFKTVSVGLDHSVT